MIRAAFSRNPVAIRASQDVRKPLTEAAPQHETGRRVNVDWVISGWVWALLIVVVLPTRADPDLWGHLRFGLDWLSTHTLSYVDPYSFTQDRPWINHEWLSEVQMALAYRSWGVPGLVGLKLFLVISGLTVLAGALASLPLVVRTASLLLATWSAIAPLTLTVRPHLWSWLFTILAGRLLMSPPSARHLAFLPVLFAVWMNVHGGVVVGLGLLAAWTAYHVQSAGRSRWMAATTVVLTVSATLVNPYGVRIWQFIGETVRIGRDIQEWRPIWTAPFEGWALPWAVAATLVLAVGLSKARPRVDRLLVLLAFAYASARTLRLVPFFVAISLIYLVPSLKTLTTWRWLRLKLWAPSPLAAVLAVVPMVAVAAGIARTVWVRSTHCVPIIGEWAPDRGVAAALHASPAAGRLVTTFGWGQYAIWHFGPSLRVSMDGRLETVYSDEASYLQVSIERGDPEGLEFLSRVRPEYVWLSPASARTRQWLQEQPDYRIDVETPNSFLGVRAGLPTVTLVRDVPSGCFPG